jgi:hypothetical protein
MQMVHECVCASCACRTSIDSGIVWYHDGVVDVPFFIPLGFCLYRYVAYLIPCPHVLPPHPLLHPSTETHSQIPEEVTAYFLHQAGVTVNDPKM